MHEGPGGYRGLSELRSAALLELVTVASRQSTTEVLEAVARALLETVGFSTVVLNVFRPEWSHYEAALVVGEDASRDALLGTCMSREVVDRLLADADRRVGSVYFLASGTSPVWEEVESVYVPDLPHSDDPTRWDPDDALLVLLVDTDGEPLGLASMDEPEAGLRPSDDDLGLIGLVCSYAEHALRLASRAEAAEREKRLLTCLTAVSPHMSACLSVSELRDLVARTVSDQFSFDRVAFYERDGPDDLILNGGYGWDGVAPLAPGIAWPDVLSALKVSPEEAGCHLLSGPVREALSTRTAASRRNGRGPRGWEDHWLVVPWPDEDGAPGGMVVFDEPRNRLLPSTEERGTLRLFIDLAVSMRDNIRQRERLDRLASQDSLTGLLNRRDLNVRLAEHAQTALLLCDLDHFKEINDRYGHEAGDRVLAAVGELLREIAGPEGAAIRYGGDEFCLILPGLDDTGAQRVALRLRTAVIERLRGIVADPVSISIGVGIRTGGMPAPTELLIAADQELYRAKQARPPVPASAS